MSSKGRKKPKHDQESGGSAEFDRFHSLAKRLIAVPKKGLDQKAKSENRPKKSA